MGVCLRGLLKCLVIYIPSCFLKPPQTIHPLVNQKNLSRQTFWILIKYFTHFLNEKCQRFARSSSRGFATFLSGYLIVAWSVSLYWSVALFLFTESGLGFFAPVIMFPQQLMEFIKTLKTNVVTSHRPELTELKTSAEVCCCTKSHVYG